MRIINHLVVEVFSCQDSLNGNLIVEKGNAH